MPTFRSFTLPSQVLLDIVHQVLGQGVVQVLHEIVLLGLVGLVVVKVLDGLILRDEFIVQVI